MSWLNKAFQTTGPLVMAGMFLTAPLSNAFGQTTGTVTPKPAPRQPINKPANSIANDSGPTITRQAGTWSADHKSVAIVIKKGTKDEINPHTGKAMTGEEIGAIIASKFASDPYYTPTKIFTEQGTGDYTGVGFLVQNHLYGPFGIKDALSTIGLVARDFEVLWLGQKDTLSSVQTPPAMPSPTGHQ